MDKGEKDCRIVDAGPLLLPAHPCQPPELLGTAVKESTKPTGLVLLRAPKVTVSVDAYLEDCDSR